ncbi:hypothetical protein NUW54_g11159 [Trametes sanguinea]|uniref:Uncharacterized protein n=1 Tax=Trametes sanguinea TaxID=158606 RepID=A0ACC1NLR8_9APHY|nr:hypothetical protein NUW54_g11159 [Trametes sanguinea]
MDSAEDDGAAREHRQAGEGVRQLLHDREFLDLMTMSHLFPETRTGYYHPLYRQDPWCNAAMSKLGNSGLEAAQALPQMIVLCKSIILTNEEVATVGNYVAYYTSDEATDQRSLAIGRIEEIQVDPEGLWPDSMLLMCCAIGGLVLPYRMPACRTEDQYVFRRLPDIAGVVSTVHNCAAHNCKSTQTRVVFQERQMTSEREAEVLHAVEPYDRLLNLAQLRNAFLLERLVQSPPRYPGEELDHIIERAVNNRLTADQEAQRLRELAAQKKTRRGRHTSGAGRGSKSRAMAPSTPAISPPVTPSCTPAVQFPIISNQSPHLNQTSTGPAPEWMLSPTPSLLAASPSMTSSLPYRHAAGYFTREVPSWAAGTPSRTLMDAVATSNSEPPPMSTSQRPGLPRSEFHNTGGQPWAQQPLPNLSMPLQGRTYVTGYTWGEDSGSSTGHWRVGSARGPGHEFLADDEQVAGDGL